MGIKNLTSIIKQHAPDGIKKVHLSEYRGRILAIDTSIYLYKYMYNGNHLEGFVRQIMRLMRNNITPLYVFDGKPPEEKKGILEDRKQKRDVLTTKKKELEDMLDSINKSDSPDKPTLSTGVIEEPIDSGMNQVQIKAELQKITKKIIRITSDDIRKCKELFRLFGVPYIDSDGEAEDLCSQLCKEGLVYGCMSEDTDILANGGCLFIRDFNANNDYVTEYTLSVILNNLKLTYNQFVDMCILCGCDYTNKISGIGPVNAFKYVLLYETIDEIITNINNNTLKKHNIPDNFDYIKARELFNTVNKTVYKKEMFKQYPIKTVELIQFINKNCNLSTTIMRVINKM